MSELSDLAMACQPHIIAITETWLDANVPDGLVTSHGFTVAARVDRACRRGGGVLVLASSDLRFRLRKDLQKWDESAWLEVFLAPKQATPPSAIPSRRAYANMLLVGCFYRAPSSDPQQFIDCLETSLDLANTKSSVLLVGDFNAPCTSWLASDSTSAAGRLLEPAALSLGLHQCVTFRHVCARTVHWALSWISFLCLMSVL